MLRSLPSRTLPLLLLALAGVNPAAAQAPSAGVLDGPPMRWHPLTLTVTGPYAEETGTPNPFRDVRLDVVFRHEASGDTYRVPGYFAADGDAAETGAASGRAWRAHFTPHRTGAWTYRASLRAGPDVSLRLDPTAGTPAEGDGASGRFTVAETDKTGRDFRGRGMLRYVGARYLRFDDGTWFVKGGADSPETLLAYAGFDGTSGQDGGAALKTYAPHLDDARPGDPVWRGDRGRGLLGALNYLAGKGANGISFITMNVEGDGRNVWPWIAPEARDRYDVSKLDQWERVFTHADSLGLFLHFKTQETENDLLLDGGELGPERKLYYRELVARFGHHHALNWNLGEENDTWDELDDPAETRVKAAIDYIAALDPYDHPIVIHTYPRQQVEVYAPLLGDRSGLHGISLQTHARNVHEDTKWWVRASAAAGRPWVVANDEQGAWHTGIVPDADDPDQAAARRDVLWANLMAGGAGVEYYFGYDYPQNDLDLESFRTRDRLWVVTRHALDFFRQHIPFHEMRPVTTDYREPGPPYVFEKPGEVVAMYLDQGEEASLELGDDGARYSIRWYDPRSGGELLVGSVGEVRAGEGAEDLGESPAPQTADWVLLVRRIVP